MSSWTIPRRRWTRPRLQRNCRCIRRPRTLRGARRRHGGSIRRRALRAGAGRRPRRLAARCTVRGVPSFRPLSASKANVEASSIRVGTEKVDALINLVGELVITQSMLGRFAEGVDAGGPRTAEARTGASCPQYPELQESVLKIRMLPISFSFNRFPRLVRELSRRLDKKIELRLRGENTELDKIVLEKIGDPLVHLVRNSLDHGIEAPAARIAAGKSETGVLELNAYHQGGSIVIEVKDDGAGLDRTRILAKARERG